VSEGSGVARARQESTQTFFDRLAGRSADFVSKAPFFTFCVLVVVIWAPSYFLVGNFDTYQLIINTPTTIITFLLVALLQNTQRRSEQALQHKLNAIADGLSDLMEHFASEEEGRSAKEDLAGDIEDLKAAVGLEEQI
jgi:low affinity Fe/Cu permease